ncbi:MAG TPA: tetratricopeptide repeat protein [Bryobacterales bacterium]|nr:tetratricopeptide repeat protein [Bryobacterales bacterium]
MLTKQTLVRIGAILIGVLVVWAPVVWSRGLGAAFSWEFVLIAALTVGVALALLRVIERPDETGWRGVAARAVWFLFGCLLAPLAVAHVYYLVYHSDTYTLWNSLPITLSLVLLLGTFYVWRRLTLRNRICHRLCAKGYAAVEHALYPQAEQFFRAAHAEARRVWFERRRDMAITLYHLAWLYSLQQRPAEAEEVRRQLLAGLGDKAGSGGGSGAALVVLRYASKLLEKPRRDRQAYAAAVPLLNAVLDCWRKAGGRPSPAAAEALHQLGLVHLRHADFPAASSLFAESAGIFEACGRSRDAAAAFLNLGNAEMRRERFEESIQAYQRALQIREKVLGTGDPLVAQVLSNLGVVHARQGTLDEAEQYYRRALAIREAKLGPEHSDLAMTLNNLAYLLVRKKQFAPAEETVERANRIWEKKQDRRLGYGLGTLAELRDAQGRVGEAAALYEQSREQKEALLGAEHPEIAESLERHAAMLNRAGKTAEADALTARAIAIRQALAAAG